MNGNNGGKDVEGDNTSGIPMGKDDEKDNEKEEEIADKKESWKDIFVSEKLSYRAVTISKRVGKEKITAWCLNKNEQGKDKKEHNLVMMQMISGFIHKVYKLGGGEKVISSKGRNVFKVKEAVKLWSPAEIDNELICNFVESNNGTILVKIML